MLGNSEQNTPKGAHTNNQTTQQSIAATPTTRRKRKQELPFGSCEDEPVLVSPSSSIPERVIARERAIAIEEVMRQLAEERAVHAEQLEALALMHTNEKRAIIELLQAQLHKGAREISDEREQRQKEKLQWVKRETALRFQNDALIQKGVINEQNCERYLNTIKELYDFKLATEKRESAEKEKQQGIVKAFLGASQRPGVSEMRLLQDKLYEATLGRRRADAKAKALESSLRRVQNKSQQSGLSLSPGGCLAFPKLSKATQKRKIASISVALDEVLKDVPAQAKTKAIGCILKRLAEQNNLLLAPLLTVEEDMVLFRILGASKARRDRAKAYLRAVGKDWLAKTNQVEQRKKEIKGERDYVVTREDASNPNSPVRCELRNIKECLTSQLQQAADSGALELIKNKQGKLESWHKVMADGGNKLTKMGIELLSVSGNCSVNNLLMVGMYEGADSHDCLKNHLGGVIDQINQLTEVNIKYNGEDVEVAMIFFLGGDYKFIFSALGLKGATADFNCPWCLRRNGCKLDDNEPFYPLRTLQSLESHLQQGHYSVSKEALFSCIPLDRVIIPILHTLTGLAEKYRQMLKDEAVKEDMNALGYPEVTTEDAAKKARNTATKEVEALKIAIKAAGKDAGVKEQLKKKKAELEQKVAACSKVISDWEGPRGEELMEAFRRFKIDTRAFGRGMNGNHAKRMLSSEVATSLWSLFASATTTHKKKVVRAMTLLGTIFDFAKSKYLTESEIDAVERKVHEYRQLASEIHPGESKTPKFHAFFTHVVPALRQHKTWGKLSEQSIESLHAVVNAYQRKYCSVTDAMDRVRLISYDLAYDNYIYEVRRDKASNDYFPFAEDASNTGTEEEGEMESGADGNSDAETAYAGDSWEGEEEAVDWGWYAGEAEGQEEEEAQDPNLLWAMVTGEDYGSAHIREVLNMLDDFEETESLLAML